MEVGGLDPRVLVENEPGGAEERRLEETMGDDAETSAGEPIGREDSQADQEDPDMGDGRVGEQPLDVPWAGHITAPTTAVSASAPTSRARNPGS